MALIAGADTNKDGKISYSEFSAMMERMVPQWFYLYFIYTKYNKIIK